MGRNRVDLSRGEDGRYRGTGVFVRCPSGRGDWEATVTAPGAGKAVFPFCRGRLTPSRGSFSSPDWWAARDIASGCAARWSRGTPSRCGTASATLPHLFFHMGRVTTYGIAGGIVGASGSFVRIAAWVAPFQSFLLAATGVLIALMGLSVGGWLPWARRIEGGGPFQGALAGVARRAAEAGGPGAAFPLGMATGLLPCGLVYTALLSAARSGMEGGSPADGFVRGFLAMAAFGAGTFPALFLFGKVGRDGGAAPARGAGEGRRRPPRRRRGDVRRARVSPLSGNPAMAVCAHCLLEVPEESATRETIDGKETIFCCPGCRAIHGLLRSEGLTGFYARRHGWTPGPPESARVPLDAFDGAVRASGRQAEADLVLSGIRCASCVWLIERYLGGRPGVLSTRVNFATGRARISWNPSETGIGDVVLAIRALGYTPYPPESLPGGDALRRETSDLLLRFGTAAFLSMQVMLFTAGLYAGYFQGIDARYAQLFRWLCFLLSTPVVFYSGAPFFLGALRGARHGAFGMDALVFLGAFSAYGYSVASLFLGGEVYFDTATMILTLILLGRYIEAGAQVPRGRRDLQARAARARDGPEGGTGRRNDRRPRRLPFSRGSRGDRSRGADAGGRERDRREFGGGRIDVDRGVGPRVQNRGGSGRRRVPERDRTAPRSGRPDRRGDRPVPRRAGGGGGAGAKGADPAGGRSRGPLLRAGDPPRRRGDGIPLAFTAVPSPTSR